MVVVCSGYYRCSDPTFIPSVLFTNGVQLSSTYNYQHYSTKNLSCLPVCVFKSYDRRVPTLDQVASVGDLCQWLYSHGKCPDFIPAGRPQCPSYKCQGPMQAQCSPIECGPPRKLELPYTLITTTSYLAYYDQNPRQKINYYHHENAKLSCLPCCQSSSNDPQKMPSKSLRYKNSKLQLKVPWLTN